MFCLGHGGLALSVPPLSRCDALTKCVHKLLLHLPLDDDIAFAKKIRFEVGILARAARQADNVWTPVASAGSTPRLSIFPGYFLLTSFFFPSEGRSPRDVSPRPVPFASPSAPYREASSCPLFDSATEEPPSPPGFLGEASPSPLPAVCCPGLRPPSRAELESSPAPFGFRSLQPFPTSAGGSGKEERGFGLLSSMHRSSNRHVPFTSKAMALLPCSGAEGQSF